MKKFAILWNILIMMVLSAVIIFAIIEGLKYYTRQSEIIQVPVLKGKTIEQAEKILKEHALKASVVDSIYQRDQIASTIYDVVPQEGTNIKTGRTIYLRIYSSIPNKKTLPDVVDLPIRAAEERLKRLGFIHLTQKEVEGPHKGLCLGVEDSEENLIESGTRVSIEEELVLLVSGKETESLTVDDLISFETDSLSQNDSIPNHKEEKTEPSTQPDNWF